MLHRRMMMSLFLSVKGRTGDLGKMVWAGYILKGAVCTEGEGADDFFNNCDILSEIISNNY